MAAVDVPLWAFAAVFEVVLLVYFLVTDALDRRRRRRRRDRIRALRSLTSEAEGATRR